MIRDRRHEQVETIPVSAVSIMRTKAFALGVEHKRSGRYPTYDGFGATTGDHEAVKRAINDCWNYERGRQWASIAPASMPLRIKGQLNPKAVHVYEAAA